MRIVLAIHSLHGGGAERQMAGLANYWAVAGHQVTLVTLDRADRDLYELDARVSRVGLDLMTDSASLIQGVLANRKRCGKLRETIKELQPEIVISFCDQMNILTLTACRGLGVKVVASEHSDPRRQKLNFLWEAWRSWAYRSMTEGVALTQEVADYLHRRSLGRPYRVIPCAVEVPKLPALERSDIILGVGRLSPEKGWDVLIQAWSLIESKIPHWRLRIVGEGSWRNELEDLIKSRQLETRIELPGWSSDVWQEYAKASLYVMPSRYEGFPVALLEALSAGVACVVTDCSQSIQTIFGTPATGGMVVKVGNAEALAEVLLELAVDSRRRGELTEQGPAIASRFSWQCVGPMWDELLGRGAMD